MHVSDPPKKLSRDDSKHDRRRRRRRRIELFGWRALGLGALALLVGLQAPSDNRAELHISPRFMAHGDPVERVLEVLKGAPEAVVVVLGPVSPSAAMAERMHGALQRVAARAPVAVALQGDVPVEALAMVAPAHLVFAEETGIILPGALPPWSDSEAMEDEALAHRTALFRGWIRERLAARGAGPALDQLEQGAILGGGAAARAGLVDRIGQLIDARDWARRIAAGQIAHPRLRPAAARPPAAAQPDAAGQPGAAAQPGAAGQPDAAGQPGAPGIPNARAAAPQTPRAERPASPQAVPG